MLFNVEIRGVRPIIHHSGAGLDPKHPANIEKSDLTRNRGSNRTESDESRIAELECQLALWLDENGQHTIPAAALRSCIETASRKLKQGPQVREGLIVSEVQDFFYDRERHGNTLDELATSTQYRVGVVVQRQRILRTRAKFDLPSGCRFALDCDDKLIDQQQTGDMAGHRGKAHRPRRLASREVRRRRQV